MFYPSTKKGNTMTENQTQTVAVNTLAVAATEANAADAAKDTLHKAIAANFDNKVDVKDIKFHFKSVKVVDPTTNKETGDTLRRPTVEIAVPVPSVEGIIAILEMGGKHLELLLEAVSDVVYARAREIVNSREDINQANFPMDELSWEKIALLPKAERRGGGIAKELWDEFSKDYIAVMPATTGKTAEQISNAAKILLNKFNAVKTNKPVLRLLKDQLGLYVTHSANAESFQDCVTFLVEKADALINIDDAALLANL